jgi:hypothetical protein
MILFKLTIILAEVLAFVQWGKLAEAIENGRINPDLGRVYEVALIFFIVVGICAMIPQKRSA